MNNLPIFLCLFTLYTEKFEKQNVLFICLFFSFQILRTQFFKLLLLSNLAGFCFHGTLPQLPDFWNPIDIFPLCSPTFLVSKENLFNKYNIPYFPEVNLITLF